LVVWILKKTHFDTSRRNRGGSLIGFVYEKRKFLKPLRWAHFKTIKCNIKLTKIFTALAANAITQNIAEGNKCQLIPKNRAYCFKKHSDTLEYVDRKNCMERMFPE